MIYRYQSGGVTGEISLERTGDEYRALVGGEIHTLRVLSAASGELNLLFDGRPIRVYYAEDNDKKWLSLDGCTYRLERPAAYKPLAHAGPDIESLLRAPMPAQVRAVLVTEGEQVEKGQPLLLLEAMKMEIRLGAPSAGVVRRLAVEIGQTVQKDQVLAEIGGQSE